MQISRLLYLILLCTTWPLLTKQHDLKKSCVQDINITDGNATHPYFKYKLHVLNDSECSLEKKKWIGKLVKCTDEDEELARIEITELEGYVCPIKTCQRLKVEHALSRNISALDDDISPMVYFVFFNTTGMQLTISQDERIRSWQLRICECVLEDNCKKGLCNVKKKMDSIGNNTFLEVKEDFLPDKCYYFEILPNSHSDCPLLTGGGFTHPSGCHPRGPASTSPQEHKQVFYQCTSRVLSGGGSDCSSSSNSSSGCRQEVVACDPCYKN
ncbi:uncharacterized protein LOC121868348 isoform X1 [Homarus americanus]|uniref:uncharacterized protein LOC121868348 isoform X1 n=1 Tax=Homarus americanus TaxID=6706 RepID=UPI001C44A3BC|nr:uncharacterized protein LOC121868348 isoform X1 [Homarus americanus]XP_042224791.1 uncharacterized protein LOC121868348 isoform X1 [Homarus americanus]